jgi:hypothetical protein
MLVEDYNSLAGISSDSPIKKWSNEVSIVMKYDLEV